MDKEMYVVYRGKKFSKNKEAIIRLKSKLITEDGTIFLYPGWQEDLKRVLICAAHYEEFIKSEDWE